MDSLCDGAAMTPLFRSRLAGTDPCGQCSDRGDAKEALLVTALSRNLHGCRCCSSSRRHAERESESGSIPEPRR